MKGKGPAAAKVEEEKKKGLALFGPKPPTPKLLRAFGGNLNRNLVDKLKVTALTFLSKRGHVEARLTAKHTVFCISSPGCCWWPVRITARLFSITPFWE